MSEKEGDAIKVLWNVRKFTILPKLIMTFLLVLVPIYTVSLMMNQSGANSVNEEISSSMKSRAHYYLNSFEIEMNRIVKLKEEYLVDNDLQELSTLAPAMTDFNRTRAILRLQQKMLLMKDSSLYIDDVKVYIPIMGRTIFTNYYGNDMPVEEWKVLNTNDQHGSPFFYWQNKLLMGGVYPRYVGSNGKPVEALEVVLSQRAIQQYLGQIINSTQGGAILINLDQKWWVADQQQDSSVISQVKDFLLQARFHGMSTGQGSMELNHKRYLTTFEKSNSLDTILLVYVPEEKILGPLEKYQVWFWLLSGLSVLIVIVFSYWIYRFIHQPLRRMVAAFRKVDKGDLSVSIHHHNEDEFHYLYEHFNGMVNRLQVLIHEVYEEKIHAQRSELKQLQSQINPHFLYNTYYALYRMAQMNDIENVSRFCRHLGDYLQFIARSASDEVRLEQEVMHARAYTEIQSMRFSKRIETIWGDLPDSSKNQMIPRLILQPILENAYNHGLTNKKSSGKVEIQMTLFEKDLLISIEDNGDELKEEEISHLQNALLVKENKNEEITGILNVHLRLQLMFGNRYGLSLSRGTSGGLRVEIRIPNNH